MLGSMYVSCTKKLFDVYEKNMYANYFLVKIISQSENYLYCFTKMFFAVQD